MSPAAPVFGGGQPSDRAPAVVWSVYLGARTAPRLAAEWGIATAQACALLCLAHRRGLLGRRPLPAADRHRRASRVRWSYHTAVLACPP